MVHFSRGCLPAVILVFLIAAGGCNGARDTALNLGETSTHRGFITRTLVNEGRTRQYCVFLPMNYTPTRKWPAIMFLARRGEAGHDAVARCGWGWHICRG